jgi:hypothetical protein
MRGKSHSISYSGGRTGRAGPGVIGYSPTDSAEAQGQPADDGLPEGPEREGQASIHDGANDAALVFAGVNLHQFCARLAG